MRGLILCLISVALALTSTANSSYAQTRLKKIRVGVPSVGMGNIIIFVTKEAKLFEKYGLDAEVITVMGSGIGSKALIRGNLDVIPHRHAHGHRRRSGRRGYDDIGAHDAGRGACVNGAA